MARFFRCVALLLGLLAGRAGSAQPGPPAQPGAAVPTEVQLLPGPATLPVTGVYTLGFRLRDGALKQYSEFPELDGFKKSGKTRTTTTRIVQGRRFTDLTITQRYMPYGEGEYTIKPFQLTVNGVVLRSGGATVRVGPDPALAAATSPVAPNSPPQAVGDLDQLFGKPKPALYQELPDRAFLAVVADRPSVYLGEGVRAGLYFYLTPADQAMLAFHDFNDQLPSLLRQLHQPTAWQEPGPEPSITPDTVRQQGQVYLRFRLAEHLYYPLTTQALHFPPLALTMVKFKFLKKPEPGQDNRLAGYKTYISYGTTVQVRALPPHPQREGAAVGSYQMREAVSRAAFRVGQSFTYSFGVEGQGNLAGLLAPVPMPRPGLDVYGPEVTQAPIPGGGRKLFRYRLVARRPGRLPLDSVFRFIVFNPVTARYDTLRPALRPLVRGAVLANAPLPKPAADPFYGPALAEADTTPQSLDVYRDVRRYANWLLAGLAAVAGFGWWRAGRPGPR